MLSIEDAVSVWDGRADLPPIDTYVSYLQMVRKDKDLQHARQAHLHICSAGLETHLAIGNYVVPMFVDCGSVSHAQQCFDRLAYRNEHSWTSIITGYTRIDQLQDAFCLYQKMQEEDVHPTSHTLVALLKACARLQDSETGQQIHSDTIDKRFSIDLSVQNTLIGMYAKCNLLSEAEEAFKKLPVRSVVSWNALITGYAEYGYAQELFGCLEQMQLEGNYPDQVTFVCALKACGNIADIGKGQELHMKVTQLGLEKESFVGSSLVGMYSKCGAILEARKVFDTLGVRDAVSYNALMAGYIEHGFGQEALQCFAEMQVQGIPIDAIAFACSIKACSRLGDWNKGQEIHLEITCKGFENDILVGTTIVAMYAQCGLVPEARQVFDKLPVRSVVSWNALISGYTEHGPWQGALLCSEEMQMEGVLMDAITVSCCLKVCSNLDTLEKGQELHSYIIVMGLEGDELIGSTLVGMYIHCGSQSDAWEVFEKLPSRDVISWTALIAGFTEQVDSQEALDCYEQMQREGISANAQTFASLLKACSTSEDLQPGQTLHMDILQHGFDSDLPVCNALVCMYATCGMLVEAQEVFNNQLTKNVMSWTALIAGYAEHGPAWMAIEGFEQMQQEGICPDVVTFTSALKACTNVGALEKGREIHSEIDKKGIEGDLAIANMLVGLYAKCGSLSEAHEVFDKLSGRDAVSWTTLIAGYVEHGLAHRALEYFEQMQSQGVPPSALAVALSLKACESLGAIEKGQQLHSEVVQRGFDVDTSSSNSLIGMYFKCGLLSEAQKVFEDSPTQDAAAWSLMIQGYGLNHQGNKALNCFQDMQKCNLKVDAVTLACLLMACSHSGLVSKGLEYFKMMNEHYGIVPTEEHCTCVVDILARSGHLYEAEKLLEMLCPLSEGAWTALLSSCKTFGESELGFRCFQQLVQVSSEDASWYVMMADIYAGAGQHDAACRIEELRKHAGAKKVPAEVSIEVNGKVHSFVVGDNSDVDVSTMLGQLNSCMKDEGHLPRLDLVSRPVSDGEKETALCKHAEKLAIAFGLLHSLEGQTLRVTKNLRMCNDCHTSSKIVSKIERREIIIRDDCCVHHFKDGLCSCGDMF